MKLKEKIHTKMVGNNSIRWVHVYEKKNGEQTAYWCGPSKFSDNSSKRKQYSGYIKNRTFHFRDKKLDEKFAREYSEARISYARREIDDINERIAYREKAALKCMIEKMNRKELPFV